MPQPISLTLHQMSRVLEVVYDNGIAHKIPFELMRVYSPSAEVQGHSPEQAVLQTGKREVGIQALEPVGNYAVKPIFTDGHQSGLFSWDYLYHLGVNEAALWDDYFHRLREAQVDRDTPMGSGGGRCG
jgi:DUF971 family protein